MFKEILKSFKEIDSISKVLPWILATCKQKPRYLPKIDFTSKSWVFKFFRLYELVFWREVGIRAENGAYVNNKKEIYYSFATVEGALTHFEGIVRGMIPRDLPFKIYVPRIITPEGFQMFTSPYLFAIAYTNSDQHRTDGTSGASSFSFTTSGSDRFLTTGAFTSNNTVTSSYNSVSMTAATAELYNSNGWAMDAFTLVNPATGSNTATVTFTTGGSLSSWVIQSYSGCAQTGQPDSATNTAYVTSSPITLSTTVVASGCWLVGYVTGNTSGSMSASTGATQRQLVATGSNSTLGGYDSNGTVGTGSQSMSITSTATVVSLMGILISVAPIASGPASVKTVNGLAIASIKNINGLATASIKSFNGLQ